MDNFLHLQGAISLIVVIFIWSSSVLVNLVRKWPDFSTVLVSPIILFFPFLYYYSLLLVFNQIESWWNFYLILLFNSLFALLIHEIRKDFKNGAQ